VISVAAILANHDEIKWGRFLPSSQFCSVRATTSATSNCYAVNKIT
jgi:hypothetical protein